MQTVTIIDQDYHGPTRNPHGEVLDRLTRQFSKVRGPADLRKALKAWGLTDEISPRQAAFWNGMKSGERRTVCRLAEPATTTPPANGPPSRKPNAPVSGRQSATWRPGVTG